MADTSYTEKLEDKDRAGRIGNRNVEVLEWKMSNMAWKEYQATQPQMPQRVKERIKRIYEPYEAHQQRRRRQHYRRRR